MFLCLPLSCAGSKQSPGAAVARCAAIGGTHLLGRDPGLGIRRLAFICWHRLAREA